MYHWL